MKRNPALAIVAAIAAASAIPAAVAAPQIGEPAPDFTLTDTAGNEHSLSDFKGKPVVLEWLNYGCPFVIKHYSEGNMQSLQEKYTDAGAVWLSVNSTNPGHKDYKDAEASDAATEKHGAKPTAVLLDEDGEVGRQYGAKTTPHMYVIDADGNLAYMGAIDSVKSTDPADIEGATNYVATALDSLMAGEPVETTTTQPYGCSVKY